MRRFIGTSAAVALLAAGSGVLAAAPAYAAQTLVVHPGQSIQAAVLRAHSGDTVVIKPGHYRESVFVGTSNLTIRGSGAANNGTIVEPGMPNRNNRCSTEGGGNGFCVIGLPGHRVNNVRISSLLVQNFKSMGIIGFQTNRLMVDGVVARNNGEYGIARFASSESLIVKNVARGNGEAGIYIGDSPMANTGVFGNDVSGNGFGIFIRHARHVEVAFNTSAGNCDGILVLDDGQPGGAGNVWLHDNTVKNNNKMCPADQEHGAPPLSGGGITLLGATNSTVGHNAVLGNQGNTLVSGGITLLSAAMFHGSAATGNTIKNNTAYRNAPADIVDHSGGHNMFVRNFCTRSMPAGLCH